MHYMDLDPARRSTGTEEEGAAKARLLSVVLSFIAETYGDITAAKANLGADKPDVFSSPTDITLQANRIGFVEGKQAAVNGLAATLIEHGFIPGQAPAPPQESLPQQQS
jgi:hypothetical protein